MPAGYGDDDDVLKVIETNINNSIDLARSQLMGAGSETCLDCGDPIPLRRRQAMPSAKYCVGCQSEHDDTGYTYFNRKGSHDSQLR